MTNPYNHQSAVPQTVPTPHGYTPPTYQPPASLGEANPSMGGPLPGPSDLAGQTWDQTKGQVGNGELSRDILNMGASGVTLEIVASAAWEEMVLAAMDEEGITLQMNNEAGTGSFASDYRDMAGQKAAWATEGPYNGKTGAAVPGTSEHGWGLAVDVNNASDENSRTYQWLAANAHRFGFQNTVPGESWHWAYTGSDASTAVEAGHSGQGAGPQASSRPAADRVYAALRASGASPAEAAALTAISGAESNWQAIQSNETQSYGREESFGYFQVHMKDHEGNAIPGSSERVSAETMNDLGLASAYALQLYRQSGGTPWMVTSNGVMSSNTGGDWMQYAVDAAGAYGDTVNRVNISRFTVGGVHAPVGRSNISPATGGRGATGTNLYPPGAQLLNNREDLFLRYRVSDGTFLEWYVADKAMLHESGYAADGADEYRGVNGFVVHAGSSDELTWLNGTVQEWYMEREQLMLSPNHPGRDSPEVMKLVAEALATGMTHEEFQQSLELSDFWDNQTDITQKWNNYSTAERAAQVEAQLFKLQADYFSIVGVRLEDNDPKLLAWATAVADGSRSYGSVIGDFQDEAEGKPESPYSRTTRAEQIAQGQFAADIENSVGELRDAATKWGIDLSDDHLEEWAVDIAMNTQTNEDFLRVLEQQAAAMFPGMPPGMNTTQYAQPWMMKLESTLETGATNMLDPRLQRALQDGVSVADFGLGLRQTDEWKETDNAAERFSRALAAASTTMGFN